MPRNETQNRPRERASAGSSWLAAGVGLVLLVVAGFGVGMVAGVVWEDPGLIFAYVTGETEEVVWDGAPEAAPDVAAGAPDSEPVVDPQLRRTAARSPADPPPAEPPAAPAAPPVKVPTPAPPPVATAPPAGNVAVQVGAFESSEAAERLAKSLKGKGYPVYVSPGTAGGSARWRVRVGPLASRDEAEKTAERIKRSEKLPTWILGEDAI